MPLLVRGLRRAAIHHRKFYQPSINVRFIARFQPARRLARSLVCIDGEKILSRCQRSANAPKVIDLSLCINASMAAPKAVVSRTTGRSTGTFKMSAMNCISQSFSVMPPSTLTTDTGIPSPAIALSRSFVWYATGIQRCADKIRRAGITSNAIDRSRAFGAQCGAPSPVRQGPCRHLYCCP